MAEAEREGPRDQLPEDLDVTAYVGPYAFPDVIRRRWIALAYVGVGGAAMAGWAVTGNGAMIGAAALMGVAALIHVVTGWRLRISESEALVVATRTVGFPVGHASAQLAFRGLRSRPTWRVLLYSADEPPSKRGLVELDAVTGDALGHYVEDNPEDWSEFQAQA